MKNNKIFDWFFRFIKGMFIGTGAILPGVSGGALAAVLAFTKELSLFWPKYEKTFSKM